MHYSENKKGKKLCKLHHFNETFTTTAWRLNWKNTIIDHKTDIIFDVFETHAWISKLSFSENHQIYQKIVIKTSKYAIDEQSDRRILQEAIEYSILRWI